MENIIIELSRYLIILLLGMYTYCCFAAFRGQNKSRQGQMFRSQVVIIFLLHFVCSLVLYMEQKDVSLLIIYGLQIVFFSLVLFLYRVIYRNLSRLILNNMVLLLMLSFIMLTRLSFSLATRQFLIASVSLTVCLIVPLIIDRTKKLDCFSGAYAAGGILLLLAVLFFGSTKNGATNWLMIGGIGFQPSEFVKIFYVFFLASTLSKDLSLKRIVKISILAAIHVMILVLEKDLGGALIFFVTYLVMLYVATKNAGYLLGGVLAGSAAACIAYRLFAHVRVRVLAFRDPFSHIDREGYQIAQSLFAIGTGGWFGLGLCQGLPKSIPVVTTDFIFAAISEELGGFVAICIILICLSCFIMFMNIAMKMKRDFYKLIALGLSTIYGFQVFLSIGGVTKCIPSTGVTLPLLSYGGSSVLSTVIIFCIIQGLYVRNR